MKCERAIIFKFVKEIEKSCDGIIAYAYKEKDLLRRDLWWTVCVSDWAYYTSNEFKRQRNTWNVLCSKLGMKVVFVYRRPIEEILLKKSEDNNLVLNV